MGTKVAVDIVYLPQGRLRSVFNMQSSVPYDGALIGLGVSDMFPDTTFVLLNPEFESVPHPVLNPEEQYANAWCLGMRVPLPALREFCDDLLARGGLFDMTPSGAERANRHFQVYGSFDDFSYE